ncbi:MAG: response regulator [Bacteroides sp.]|nr:response regulator [Bacteroides sp.]
MQKATGILLCLIISTFSAAGGKKEAHYVLSNKDGLSNNSVTCICQDSTGIVWIGTWEGLNSYNSSEFKIWKSNPADNNTLSSNIIRSIDEQKKGIVWVTTDNGVNRIDLRQDRIRRFYLGYEHKNPAKDKTFDLSISDSRQIFCSAYGWGLAYYNEATDRMEPFNIPDMNTSDVANIHCIGKDRLIIISQSGSASEVRYRFRESGEIEIAANAGYLPGTRLSASFKSNSSLFLVSRDSLYRDTSGGAEAFALPYKGEVRAVTEVSENEIIIAFYDFGVMRLNLENGHCNMISALEDVNIFALHYGTQDILWAGTDGQGLWAIYDDAFNMGKVSSAVMFKSGKAPVRSFFKDGDRLFVGTKGNGIFVMESDSLVGRYDRNNGLADNSVYAFERGYNDDVFIGTGEYGLNVLSLKTGEISRILPDDNCLFNEVYDIKRDDSNGYLWIGTYGCGLIRLRLEYHGGKYHIAESLRYANSKERHGSINSNIVFPLLLESPDVLWVGTKGGGLDRLDIRTGTFTHSTVSTEAGSISSNDVSSLFFSRDSTLWVGTSYGLDRMISCNGRTCTFASYTDVDGLGNNSTHGIAEDSSGKLWISTSGGLSVFNPGEKSFINYSNDDALQNNEYADGACLIDGNTVYFGGVDGYNMFNPDEIHRRPYMPRIVFSGIKIMGNAPQPFSEDLTLRHDENFFDIRFSAIEFIDNSKCEYAYMLEGFNTGWVYTGSGVASFTNVPPGKYTFKVKCTNGDKVWNGETADISIRIMRPWWNTIAANILYILALIALTYLIAMFFNERVRQRHALEIESLKKKKLVDTYEAKLSFFTNIAHEFMTPLTLIIGPIEQMAMGKYNFPQKVNKYHRIIYSNAERMRRLIQELIDFRRIDTDNIKPVYSNIDIAEITDGILDNFSEINEEQHIALKRDIPSSGLPMVCDRNAVEKILYNLISNAYKYTPAGGEIQISTGKEGGQIYFAITNSGKGIRPENLDKVFDRFVILDNYESQASKGNVIRNGIGMALVYSLVKMLGGDITVSSVPGKSATFRLSLPEGDSSMISGPLPMTGLEYAHNPVNHGEILPEKVDSGSEAKDIAETIMIVDDDNGMRELVADILGESYRIVQAGNGIEAIEHLRQIRPDLIITDLNMPGMNGAELLKYVKDNEVTKSIPVIFLAFRSDMDTEAETYELGSEVFIPKPFSTRHLIAVVRQVLKNRSVLKEWYNSALSSTDVYQGNIVDASDKDFIVKLTQTIEEKISDEELSLDWLCREMGISRTQMYRKVKELASMTPVEFIRTVKLNKAAMLLKTTSMTVQEIMYSSGFNNKSYFYREFAAVYKCSPKEYRKLQE